MKAVQLVAVIRVRRMMTLSLPVTTGSRDTNLNGKRDATRRAAPGGLEISRCGGKIRSRQRATPKGRLRWPAAYFCVSSSLMPPSAARAPLASYGMNTSLSAPVAMALSDSR